MKRIVCLLLTLALLLSALPALAADRAVLGAPFQDFTVTTIDGEEFTLSKALEQYEMVFINLFATWCPPCAMEFPFMQQAYEEYKDRVGVMVISIEETDTPDELRSYRQEKGLTLPMAPAGSDWIAQYAQAASIPTSLVVDRFGNLTLRHVGAVTDADTFRNLFDAFLGEDYTRTKTYTSMPQPTLTLDFPADSDLSAALNAEDSAIAFTSDPSHRGYPFQPTEQNGQRGVSPVNMTASNSEAVCIGAFTAQAGDALAFVISSDIQIDNGSQLLVELDGAVVKQFTGKNDSRAWAIPLTEGNHEIRFLYDQYMAQETDWLFLSGVRLLSGKDAEAALAALPVYPAFDTAEIIVTSENVQRGHFLYLGEPVIDGCVAMGDTLDIEVKIPSDADPETVLFLDTTQSDDVLQLSSLLTPDGTAYHYRMDLKAGAEKAQIAYAVADSLLPQFSLQLLVMPDEAAVQQAIKQFAQQGYDLTWVPEQ